MGMLILSNVACGTHADRQPFLENLHQDNLEVLSSRDLVCLPCRQLRQRMRQQLQSTIAALNMGKSEARHSGIKPIQTFPNMDASNTTQTPPKCPEGRILHMQEGIAPDTHTEQGCQE